MSNAELFVLVQTIAESLRVWVKRGEVALTEDQIMERARNCADSLRSTFMIIPLPSEPESPMWRTPLISDPPPRGHSWSCQCTACHTAKQTRRS